MSSTRSVVFKTPGKLDLRSIMTFGLNAKPNTGHPIGFFGTGLKYALAVLTRNKIPVTLYIDGQKWSITTEDSVFRDKTVTEVFLERHRKILSPSVRKLPFTTELGKTWELWQVYRELESNTRDENGDTYVTKEDDVKAAFNYLHDVKGHTLIVVESEKFVEEHLDRDKTFLPDGLTQRDANEDIQVFNRPSHCIYYRGIRVLDLGNEERSELTYNILRAIELTEDRTAKDKWDLQYRISRYLAQSKEPEIITKAITAPKRAFESSLNYSWGTPSTEFLNIVETTKDAQTSAKETLKSHRPRKAASTRDDDWYEDLIQAIKEGDEATTTRLIFLHSELCINALRRAQTDWKREKANNDQDTETDQEGRETTTDTYEEAHQTEDDDIPF